LVVVGEEVGVAGVWLIGIEYRGLESTRHKVIGAEPKGVEYRGPKSIRHKVIGVEPEGGCHLPEIRLPPNLARCKNADEEVGREDGPQGRGGSRCSAIPARGGLRLPEIQTQGVASGGGGVATRMGLGEEEARQSGQEAWPATSYKGRGRAVVVGGYGLL
jgi:hypothetical protein